MTTIQLYKKGNAIGPIETEGAIQYGVRLVSDEGKTLRHKSDEVFASCIDVYPNSGSVEDWEEVDYEEEEIDYEEIGKILTGEEVEEE